MLFGMQFTGSFYFETDNKTGRTCLLLCNSSRRLYFTPRPAITSVHLNHWTLWGSRFRIHIATEHQVRFW